MSVFVNDSTSVIISGPDSCRSTIAPTEETREERVLFLGDEVKIERVPFG